SNLRQFRPGDTSWPPEVLQILHFVPCRDFESRVMSTPVFTCIVLSHDKPDHVVEALASLAVQTFRDWEAIVFDSGVLTDRGFFEQQPLFADPRVRLVRSWETEELRKTRTIASWCFNECFRKNLVRGQYVTYLCDDD